MATTFKRYTPFVSKLDMKKDIRLDIMGFPVIIEFNYHSSKQSNRRDIFESSVIDSVKKGFHRILELKANERFLMISKRLGITVVCTTYGEGMDIVVSILSVIDDTEPSNLYNTLTIAI